MTRVDEAFRRALRSFPSRVAVRYFAGEVERTLTYQAAGAIVADYVGQLQAAGLRSGDRAVACYDSIVSSLFVQLAAACAGVVVAPLGPATTGRAVADIARRTDARVLLVAGEPPPGFGEAGLPVVKLPPPSSESDGGRELIEELAAHRSASDDVYMLQPTSGTSGEAKLCVRPHRAFLRAARLQAELALGRSGPEGAPERILMVASLTHGMGQYLLAMVVFLAAEAVVPSAADTAASLDEVRRLAPTYLCLTPRVLRSLLAQHAAGGRVDAALFGDAARAVSLGGAHTDPSLIHQLLEKDIPVYEWYGASECSLVAVTHGRWREGVIGRVLDDCELRIADDGEILVRSPVAMLGYWGDEAKTREAFLDGGWYRTGDLGELTRDGELRLLGRKRDVFNTFDGANVYPAHIESLLEGCRSVDQVVLVGDQRPYITAIVAARDAPPDDLLRAADGVLDPTAHADLYRLVADDLAAASAGLEPNLRVRRFVLLAAPMGPELYARVGHDKVRRDRRAIQARYAGPIEAMYADASRCGCVADRG